MNAFVLRFLIVVAVLSSSASAASAQNASDQSYCLALSDLYIQYLGHDIESSGRTRTTPSLEPQVAVAQCKQGNPGPAIPVLERALRGNGFTLPRRG